MDKATRSGASLALQVALGAAALAAAWIVYGAFFGRASASAAEPTPANAPLGGLLSSTAGSLDAVFSQLGGTAQGAVSAVTMSMQPVVTPLSPSVGSLVNAVPALTAPVTALLESHPVSSVTAPVSQVLGEVLAGAAHDLTALADAGWLDEPVAQAPSAPAGDGPHPSTRAFDFDPIPDWVGSLCLKTGQTRTECSPRGAHPSLIEGVLNHE